MSDSYIHDPEKLADEDLFKKHRQERKDLQAKIQSLKKSVPKGDKKKKKEILELITKLETELNEKQNKELSAESEETPADLLPNDNLNESEDAEVDCNSSTRTSKARRRREKKDLEEREREKRILQESETLREGPRQIEANKIKEHLKSLGLDLHNIPADGNCLYCAVNHQLESKGIETHDVSKLREMTADFIRQNKDDFIPFMCNDDTDEPISEAEFEKFCNDVARTKLWGGQLELRALSQVLKCPIKVIQSSGPPTIQGENLNGPELVLTYHRHLYRLGEHYNSTMKSEVNNDEDYS